MLAGKKPTDFTSMFSPHGFDHLSDQTKYRLDEIRMIENCFNSEINQRKLCGNKLSKYVSTFEYIDKIFIV